MATERELTRIADAVNALRPNWLARTTRVILTRPELRDRAFADLAAVMALIACDPDSAGPARAMEAGPWWQITRAATGHASTQTPGPGPDTPCQRPGHEHEPARACRACRAEQLANDAPEPAGTRPTPPPPGFRPARAVQPADPRPGRAVPGLAPTPLEVVRCRCAGTFTDTPPGRTAHHAVFGHWPEQSATQAATGPGQVKE